MSLPELLGLLGGPDRVLLVGAGPSGSKARLQAFARELFREEEGEKGKEEEGKGEEEEKESKEGGREEEGCNGAPASSSRREVRVSLGWSSSSSSSGGRPPLLPPLSSPPPAGLAVVLFGAPSLLLPGERRLLREILRDLRLRLDSASRQRPPVAVVGVAALQKDPGGEAEEGEEEARSQLQALLRGTFGGSQAQAALHRPGGGAREVREAACRALRAALRLRSRQTDEVEAKKQKLPLFLKCLPWGRRRQQRKGHLGTDANKFSEDTPQDQDEGLALT